MLGGFALLNKETVVRIPPKTISETYQKQSITIIYLPADRQWQWLVEYTSVQPYSGTAPTLERARKDAHKLVDKLEGNAP